MKILLLPSWYPTNENKINGIFFKEQAEALLRYGVDIRVLTINLLSIKEVLKRKQIGLEIVNENGVKVYRYTNYNYFPRMTSLYLKYYGVLVKKLIKEIESYEGKIDIVHIHSALDAGLAYSLSKIEIPYVVTEHSTKYSRKLIKNIEEKYLFNVFKKAKSVIVVGCGLKEEIKKYVENSEIIIIPNMVSLERKDIKIGMNNRFRFFSLGLLSKKKGMDILIESFYKYSKELDNVELYIGGSGEEAEALKRLIKKYELEGKIKLLGKLNREEVQQNMANCNAFILASRHETFGIVYLEAMLYGKPVIATKTGGPDTFITKETGILIPVEDIDATGRAMIDIKDNIGRYRANDISDYCIENFKEENICKKLVEVYENVISKKN